MSTETQAEQGNVGPGGSGPYVNEHNDLVSGGSTWPTEVTSQAGELMDDCMNPPASPHEDRVPKREGSG